MLCMMYFFLLKIWALVNINKQFNSTGSILINAFHDLNAEKQETPLKFYGGTMIVFVSD